jgi:tetratricopeptide (TPR) repeat protein
MRKYFPIICIVAYTFIFSNAVFAQQDSIDIFVNSEMQKRRIPGLQLAIVQNESIVKTADEKNAWQKVTGLPMDFLPGEKFSYNQTNYLLLGRIIHSLSGMPFTEFIIKEQLLKVGMPNTIRSGFGAAKKVIAHSAGGYRYEGGALNNMFFSMPPSLQTAAGMSSTAKEISYWIIALQNNQLIKDKLLLDLLWTPARLNNNSTAGFSGLLNGYAVGWPTATRAEHPAAAAVGGARSAVFVYPNDNLSIVVLTNLAGGSPEEFIDEIAGFYIPAMKESNGFGLSTSVRLLKAQLEKSGYKKAIDEVKRLSKTNSSFKLGENEVNGWGYKLMRQGRLNDALEIFKLNVFLFPASSNTFDSLGEIYAELGDIKLSIKNYEQSLQLDPQNRNALEQIEKFKNKNLQQ